MVYGYSHSSCCVGGQYSFARGTYARPTAAGPLEPIDISGKEEPTLFGSRMIARTGRVANVQASAYSEDFTPWLDTTPSGLDLRRTDVAANGQMVGLELEQWTNGTQTTGKIALIIALRDRPAPDVPGRRRLLRAGHRRRQGRVALPGRDTRGLERR